MPHPSLVDPILGAPSPYQGAKSDYLIRLRTALRAFRGYIEDPDFTLEQDPKAYDKMLRDTVVADAWLERAHKIAGRGWSLVADEGCCEDAIPYIEPILKQIRDFAGSRLLLGGHALLQGLRIGQIIGEFREMRLPADDRIRRWWVPTQIIDVPKQRVRLASQMERGRIETWWELYDIGNDLWRKIEHPEWFIWHAYLQTEDSFGRGTSIGEGLYYFWYAKTHLLEMWMRSSERWGEGVLVAFVEALEGTISASGVNRTFQQIQDAWKDVLERMKARHVGVFDKSADVKSLDGPGQGYQIITEGVKYVDQAMENILKGRSGANDPGSFAKEVEKGEAADDRLAFDHSLLGESLSRWLVGLVWRLNMPHWLALGFGGQAPPRIKIRTLRREDPVKALAIMEGAQRLRLSLREEEVYERLDLGRPGEDDEVIEPPAAPAGPQGAAPGFAQEPTLPRPVRGFAHRKSGRKVLAPNEEIERLFAGTAAEIVAAIETLMASSARHVFTRAPLVLQDDPGVRELVEKLRTTMAVSDALGGLRLLRELEAQGVEIASPAPRQFLEGGGGVASPDLPDFLRMRFDEAIEDLMQRAPVIAGSAEELRERYSRDRVFGMVRASVETTIDQARAHLTRSLAEGRPFGEFGEFLESLRATGFDRRYAEVVYRTNLNGAYTAGRWAQVERPEMRSMIVGWEYQTAGDRDVRPNHAAADGFRASLEDPVWDRLSPPLGYNCRCAIRAITRPEAEGKGWLGEDGALSRVTLEPGAGPDYPTFGRRPRR